MAEEPLPGLKELHADPGQWVVVRPPVSHPTATNGDWRTFPHLTSKENWKRLMGARAEAFEKFLDNRRIYVNECPICSKCGHGMRASFGGHVGAVFHFKDIGKVALPDGVPVNEARAGLWQEFRVPGGAVRFNHADGAIEMMTGSADAEAAEPPRPSSSAVGRGLCPPAAGGSGPAATTDAPSHSVESMAELPVEGRWYRISHPVGMPTQADGDYRTCSFLGTRNLWKQAVSGPAGRVLQLLERYNVWPECKLCAPQPCSFAEHIPAEKHFRSLESKLPEGVPVKTLANKFWQQWNVPGGAVRFNHIHGAIDLWRGQPPQVDDEAAGGATSVPQAPQASPAASSHGPAPHAEAATAAPKHSGKPEPAALETEGQWYCLCPPASMAQTHGGDWRAYSHMQSRHSWKAAFTEPAALVCQVLEGQRAPIYPECCFCERSRGYQEHVPADKHFRTMYDKFLKDGVPVERVRHDAWQQWLLPGGAIRLNHLDGSVEMCKGDVPVAGAASPAKPAGGGLLDMRKFDSPEPRPPAHEPNETPPRPPSRGEPDAEPQAASSQSSILSRSPASQRASAAAASSPHTPEQGVLELCNWLWSQEIHLVAGEVESKLRDVAPERLRCKLCDARMEGVAQHLVSVAHMQHVAAAIAHLLPTGRAEPPSWSPSVVQYWDLPGGGQLKFCHFPPALELEERGRGAPPAPDPEELGQGRLPSEWQTHPQSEWRTWAEQSRMPSSEVNAVPAPLEATKLPEDRPGQWHKEAPRMPPSSSEASTRLPDAPVAGSAAGGRPEWQEQQQDWRSWAAQSAAGLSEVTRVPASSEVARPPTPPAPGSNGGTHFEWQERQHEWRQWTDPRQVPPEWQEQQQERPQEWPRPWAAQSTAGLSEVTRVPASSEVRGSNGETHPEWQARQQEWRPWVEQSHVPSLEANGMTASLEATKVPEPMDPEQQQQQRQHEWRPWAAKSQAALSEVTRDPATSENAGVPQTPEPIDASLGALDATDVSWKRHERSDGKVYWERSDEQMWFFEGSPEWQRWSAGEGRGAYYYNSQTHHWFWETGQDMGIWKD